MSESNFVKHVPCPHCGSKDNRSLYDDGHTWCVTCPEDLAYGSSDGEYKERGTQVSDTTKATNLTPVTDIFREIPRRGLSEASIRKYEIDVCMDKSVDVAHRYPYFKNGRHIANKVRRRSDKAFYWEGNPDDAELFGQHLFPAGSAKSITLVEGELDAPSAWLLLGSRYPVVSVPSVGHALKACKANYEYLNSFEDIVICFDKDDAKTLQDGSLFYPGQDTAKKVAEMFKPGKCRILILEHGKDPNDYRQNDVEAKVFISEWWKATRFTPDGLILGTDMLDKIRNRPQHFQTPYPFEGINAMTYGIRLSELVVINAPTGVGKTSLLKEIEYGLLVNPEVVDKGYGVGFLHLEELDTDLALGLMSIHNSKPYHLPDVPRTDEELEKAFDAVINTSRVVIYDHFGSNEIEAILSRVRHMAALGCKYIVLDHLSIVVSDQAGDERKQLDEITTKLKTFCMEANVALIAVIHQNRQGLIRGTAGVEQLANIVLRLERDLVAADIWRRNITKVYVEKNRFSGRTGPAAWLFYDDVTGRLAELDGDAVNKYEEGMSINDTDIPF